MIRTLNSNYIDDKQICGHDGVPYEMASGIFKGHFNITPEA